MIFSGPGLFSGAFAVSFGGGHIFFGGGNTKVVTTHIFWVCLVFFSPTNPTSNKSNGFQAEIFGKSNSQEKTFPLVVDYQCCAKKHVFIPTIYLILIMFYAVYIYTFMSNHLSTSSNPRDPITF